MENVTVTSVGPTSITIAWNVSQLASRKKCMNSVLECLLSLPQRYEFPSRADRTRLQVWYVDSSGYSRTRTIYYYSYTTTTSWTFTGLSFGETYNISMRAQVRFSYCYTYLYGEYSDELVVETIETGKFSVYFGTANKCRYR